MSELLQQKFAILTSKGRSVSNRNAPHNLISKVTGWIKEGKIEQINMPNKPFDKPYGQSYVGGDYGKDGTAYVDNYWGSTHDGCREFEIDSEVLTLRIFDGNNFDGAREGLRGAWKFKLNFDWTEVPEFARRLQMQWDMLIDDRFDDEEEARVKAAKALIEAELLGA